MMNCIPLNLLVCDLSFIDFSINICKIFMNEELYTICGTAPFAKAYKKEIEKSYKKSRKKTKYGKNAMNKLGYKNKSNENMADALLGILGIGLGAEKK